MLETPDFRDFSVSTWYNKFKNISLHTILIDIPDELVSKFQAGDSDINIQEVCSCDFIDNLKNALSTLGNNAFIKNNWHAPMDAKMFSFGNTLKVCNVDDILLYFSISNIIQEDLSTIKGVPFSLALKPWKSIHPASEFRCIAFIGITPRDWPTFYAHFHEEGPEIIDTLTIFFNENIKTNFPRKNYIFDVVLSYKDKPYILDFGPLNSKTNIYAFSWKEIQPLLNKESPEEVAAVFRYLETDIGIMTKSDALYKIAKSTGT